MGGKSFPALLSIKVPGGELGDHGGGSIHDLLEAGVGEVLILVDEDLGGPDLLDEGGQCEIAAVALDGAEEELGAGEITVGGGDLLLCQRNGEDEGVASAVQVVVLDDGGRRDDLHHLPLGQSLAPFAQFGLLTDGDLLALVEQALDVASRRMVGDPAHGGVVALGQREVEQGAHRDGVLLEHLIEVAEAEEEDRIGVLLLDLTVLDHHRSGLAPLIHDQYSVVVMASTRLRPLVSPLPLKKLPPIQEKVLSI